MYRKLTRRPFQWLWFEAQVHLESTKIIWTSSHTESVPMLQCCLLVFGACIVLKPIWVASRGLAMVEPSKLITLKCANHHRKGNSANTHFKWSILTVCRATSRWNHWNSTLANDYNNDWCHVRASSWYHVSPFRTIIYFPLHLNSEVIFWILNLVCYN